MATRSWLMRWISLGPIVETTSATADKRIGVPAATPPLGVDCEFELVPDEPEEELPDELVVDDVPELPVALVEPLPELLALVLAVPLWAKPTIRLRMSSTEPRWFSCARTSTSILRSRKL